MRLVSRFESNLLRFVYAMVERVPREQVLPLLKKRVPRPRCVRRDAVELVRDALGKGTVLLLAREGWRRVRRLRGAQVRDGRLWQRTPSPELGLAFSPHALELLIWLAASDSAKKQPGAALAQLTTGDLLLAFLAYRLLRATEAGPLLRIRTSVARNGLCRLMFPEDFADAPLAGDEWRPWTAGVGSCILECLQRPLAARWIETEGAKERIKDAVWMRTLGQRQARILESFCAAMSAAGRRDLARFLLATAQAVLADNPSARRWIGGLNVQTLRLAERVETYRAATALLRQMNELQRWEAEARGVGYFDEGYAASQLWKADWEHYQGDDLCRRAEAIVRETEPLQT